MLLSEPSIWLLVKVLFLVGLSVYLIFAAVVVRQVYLMTETLEVGFETPVRALVWLHLAVAIGVFILALFVL